MRLSELREGRVSDAYLDGTYHTTPAKPAAPAPEEEMKFMITIEHRPWKKFATKEEAMKVANNVYNKNPRRRVDVVPL